MLIATIGQYVFGITIFITSMFLVLLVLVQRGRGGGLAGALGGPGGQSAFGTKAGDLFTKITVGVAAFWICLCVIAVMWLKEKGLETDVKRRDSSSIGSTAGEKMTGETPRGLGNEIPGGLDSIAPGLDTAPGSGLSPSTLPANQTNGLATPNTETPATETPATETPATETPATETPAGEAPAGDTPAGEPATTDGTDGSSATEESPQDTSPTAGEELPANSLRPEDGTPAGSELPASELPASELPANGGVGSDPGSNPAEAADNP